MAYSKLVVKNHLPEKELKEKYLSCEDSVERSHWQIIWLMARSSNTLSASETADVTGFCSDWVRKIIRRYNKEGPDGIEDKRKYNGNEPILSDEQKKELLSIIQKDPEDGGLWTGPKIAKWISKKLNCRVSAVTGWKYLKRLGFTLQIPRPQHQKAANKEEQEAFKKNSN